MGIPGELRSPRVFAAYERVAAACERHGKTLGVAGVRNDIDLAGRLVRLGGRFVIAGSDTGYLLAAATASVAEFRSIELAAAPASTPRFA
jgi:2-keto-3-deoxy-L-rhamnonate aldolase RhmA